METCRRVRCVPRSVVFGGSGSTAAGGEGSAAAGRFLASSQAAALPPLPQARTNASTASGRGNDSRRSMSAAVLRASTSPYCVALDSNCR
ncbi:hypothetical protein [Kitasatospora sp. NPDC057541]|uniref:hypothetical protein n=1 Tax=Kitasatospora sp. NPDC057541 TaxID=3346161 RepID=UPI0036965C8A